MGAVLEASCSSSRTSVALETPLASTFYAEETPARVFVPIIAIAQLYPGFGFLERLISGTHFPELA